MFLVIIAQLATGNSPEIHITLVFAITFAVIVLMATGMKWKRIEEGILHGCKIATVPMMILMFIGMLIPMLIACGTIPALIYYGLKIISPSIFLVTAALVCPYLYLYRFQLDHGGHLWRSVYGHQCGTGHSAGHYGRSCCIRLHSGR